MADSHYDVIIIGSGPGGASVASRLAPTGKRILILERGDYLPRSRDNWDARKVFEEGVYQARETWYDREGKAFAPGLHYYVGGNSKFYGAALIRLREKDFEEIEHGDGISPAWPISYADLAPYYTEAERLFHVHGQRGEDPTEPPCEKPFPYPAVSHEPRIAALHETLQRQGLRPFHLPLGILLDEKDGKPTRDSVCIRCDTFDGFPCLLNGKADAQVVAVDPTLRAHANVELRVRAYVARLETDPSGGKIAHVVVASNGEEERLSADIVVVACGALSSALLLLRSANDKHPRGLANGSGQVGRNYMRHNQSVLMALMKEPNDVVFQKTLAVSDYYFASDEWRHPLGLVQMCATTHGPQIRSEVLPHWLEFLPNAPFENLAAHALAFWLSSEDLPLAENRIAYDGQRVVLAVRDNNMEAHRRLRQTFERHIGAAGARPILVKGSPYFTKSIDLSGTAHQAGTLRFGRDPATSVLDPDCRAHEFDNLYVADGGFFPSIGAVNPTLTIIANALRVADVIKRRLG